MAKQDPDAIFKDKLDLFYGGISEDIRIQKKEISRLISHFDSWTNPKRLTPYRAMEADQNTADGALPYKIVQFLVANSILFGYGIVTASAKAKIYQKATDNLTGQWTASTSGEDGGGTRFTNCFLHFHNYLYGGSASSRIWAWGDLTGSPSFTSTAYSIANGPSAQGLVTSDDLLLIPCYNKMAKKDGAGSGPTNAWTTPLTIPDYYTMVDICEYDEGVAIALAPTSTVIGSTDKVFPLNSKVILWDKVNSDPYKVIDWGEGAIRLLENVEGQLVGISSVGGGSSYAVRAKLVTRVYEGGTKANQKFELESDDSTLTIYGNHCKVLDGNRLVFGMKIKLDGVTYNQLFTIGRKTTEYPLAHSFDRLVNNDTALTGNIDGLFKIGNYFYCAYNQDGSINRTNDSAVYTNATASYITQKFNGERQLGPDAGRLLKQLVMAGLEFVPLTSGQSLSLYYRYDANSSWTLIRTYSTVNGMNFEASGEDNGSGDPLGFGNCYEFQFKVTATGGAEPTAVIYAFKQSGGSIISS